MTAADRLAEALTAAGIALGPALGDRDRSDVEDGLGVVLPADLAALLAVGVPTGPGFPDWHGDREVLAEHVHAPIEGLLFDVANNDLWLPEWGSRPADLDRARDRAVEHLERAPRLVPVYRHRYLPSVPAEAGNPVLSVMQADIVVYGTDLADYFGREFGVLAPSTDASSTTPRPIGEVPFWSRFAG